MKRSITPCLWYEGNAEEAARFYCRAFKEAKITAQSPIVTEIELSGQKMICLNGGSQYHPNASISFFYIFETEDELEAAWKEFEKEGQVMMPLDQYPWSPKYGWIQDQYGVSWQLSLGGLKDVGQKIITYLMFTGEMCGRAEEAMEYYMDIFEHSEVVNINRYLAGQEPNKEGDIAHALFTLNGQRFMAMDSADPHAFGFDEGVSLTVYCENQEEIDYFWERLTDGGQESRCGWLRDKFGVVWQIIPVILGELMNDPAKAPKAVQAFMEMKKFDIETLVNATL